MNVAATETKKTVKSAFNDEFENYLKKQQVKTTFKYKLSYRQNKKNIV